MKTLPLLISCLLLTSCASTQGPGPSYYRTGWDSVRSEAPVCFANNEKPNTVENVKCYFGLVDKYVATVHPDALTEYKKTSLINAKKYQDGKISKEKFDELNLSAENRFFSLEMEKINKNISHSTVNTQPSYANYNTPNIFMALGYGLLQADAQARNDAMRNRPITTDCRKTFSGMSCTSW